MIYLNTQLNQPFQEKVIQSHIRRLTISSYTELPALESKTSENFHQLYETWISFQLPTQSKYRLCQQKTGKTRIQVF